MGACRYLGAGALGLWLAACATSDASSTAPGALGNAGAQSGSDAATSLPADAGMTVTSSPYPNQDYDASSAPAGDAGGCEDGLELTIRDFTEKHPDFERSSVGFLEGIVKDKLDADHKPVYAASGSTITTTGPAEFAQWYHDVDGVNMRIPVKIKFTEAMPGQFVYDNEAFFPIDNMGFGNGPKGITIPILGITLGGTVPDHNFLFTTEAHTRFTYQGGEKFTFKGDDDLWVFINDMLAVDLGGVHGAMEKQIDLDAMASQLGIAKGNTYAMDIFHAERHTTESHYRIETTIDLSCIQNVPVVY